MEGNRNHSAIMDIIQGITKISLVDHAVMKICIICIPKEDSPSINTLRDPLRKGTGGQRERERNNQKKKR